MSALAWCVVMSDSRPFNDSGVTDWQVAARINRNYAAAHGYGFLYAQVGSDVNWEGESKSTPACVHPKRGARVAAWCKVPVVASVLLFGIEGRRCDNVMYIDADAIVTNRSLSIEGYLERARSIGDEALLEPTPWTMLFSSNWWFQPDGPCSGLFWVRNTPDGCGILRRWWDAAFDSNNAAHPWEQAPLAAAYRYKRAYGARVRVMPTARNWHYEELPAKPTEPHDPFTIHGLKSSYGYGDVLRKALAASEAEARAAPAAASGRAATLQLDQAFASRLFDGDTTAGLSQRCPRAVARSGADGFDDETQCCGGEVLRPSQTNLDGSVAPAPRKCWSPSFGRDSHTSCAPRCEVWSCWRLHTDDMERREADEAEMPAATRGAWAAIYGGEAHRTAARASLRQLVDSCWCGMGNALIMDATQSLAPASTTSGVSAVGLWHPNYFSAATGGAAAYAALWRGVAPRVEDHLAVSYALRASPSFANTTTVHVRCSDVPFRRMPWYHIQQTAFWSFVVRQLREKRAPRAVTIFNASVWMQEDPQRIGACEAYAAAIASHLERHGFDVSFAARGLTEEATLEAFLGSSALVSATPSSFSFLPGLALAQRGDLFITPLFFTETAPLHAWYDQQRAKRGLGRNATVPNIGVELEHAAHVATHSSLPGLVPWTMYRRPPLLHADVDDYVRLLRGYASALSSSPASHPSRASRRRTQ